MYHDQATFLRAAPAGLSLKLQSGLNPAQLLAVIVGIAGLQNLLLLRFLGITSIPLFAAGAAAILLLCIFVSRLTIGSPERRPTVGCLAFCVASAALLFVLGGEGRFFYANFDWQVRDAVMNDMIVNPWPFAYPARGTEELLRAPLGMYLLPALVGKIGGGMPAADLALLVQNSLFLGTLLGLGSSLFETGRARLAALLIFLAFSGMDIIGWLARGGALDPLEHIEGWASIQYSSTVTLASWVPQHALVGWTGGILFLLWRRGILPFAGFVTPLPLLALWSPLGLMGALPFAAYAFLMTAISKRLTAADILAPASATLLSIGSLLYLQSGSGSVGIRIFPLDPGNYFSFQMIEVVPYVLALWALSAATALKRDQLIIAASCLLLFPFVQIGMSFDFMMRASIPALTVLTILVAEAVVRTAAPDVSERSRSLRRVLVVALLIGSATPATELARAVTLRPSPYPLCSLQRTADEAVLNRMFNGSMPADMSTYLAEMGAVPSLVRPQNPFLVRKPDPETCWARPWVTR